MIMNITILNKCLLASFCMSFIQDSYTDYIHSTNMYAYRESDAVLLCPLAINNTNQRWLKENSILTTGRRIHKTFLNHKRLKIYVNYKEKKYNLLIANVRESDYGDYECIIQNKQGVFTSKSKITLKRPDDSREVTTTAVNDKIDQTSTDDGSEITTTADHEKMEQSSTATMDTSQRDGSINDATNTTEFFRDYLYYILLAIGLIVILSISVGSNICINRNSKGQKFLPKHENKMPNNDINEPVQELDVDEEVIYEICSSEYEYIDERQMIKNGCSAVVDHDFEPSTNSKAEDPNFALQVGPYLDVIDDTCYQLQDKHVHGCIPSCHSTLTKLSETKLQNYETIFPTDRTQEVGILQITTDASNDTEDLAESFKILHETRNSSYSSNSTHSSAGNDGNSTQQDDYLNPYMPLNTNEMDYLESYSAPISRSETNMSKDNKD